MPKVTIDNVEVEVAPGATILDAARAAGVEIPTLCHRDGHPPLTSCFVCVVRVHGTSKLVPSCATQAIDGMIVESETDEVRLARRMALELLLSDHLGDCQGPCQGVCPARMDIPKMIRLIAEGKPREALITVKERISLPAVLGRICPELCEKGCRRAVEDAAVSICKLKRYVADVDLASGDPYLPPCLPATGKRVAIVGAGPAGLSAAYYLLQQGVACDLYDDHEKPGGMLRYAVDAERLPHDVLDAEIALIERLGARFRLGARVESLAALREEYDAVLVATGPTSQEAGAALGLPMGKQGVAVNRTTLSTELPGVFAAGSALAAAKHAVRAVGEGRLAATAIAQYLAGEPLGVERREFNVRMGKLDEAEVRRFTEAVSPAGRLTPAEGPGAGFATDEALQEALRCLRCDCRKLEECRLRRTSIACGASPTAFKADRRRYEAESTHPDVIYEPGKCIACGICVQIATESQEELGLTFIGRGFSVRIGVPFSEALSEGLRRVARECAEACPTAALSLK